MAVKPQISEEEAARTFALEVITAASAGWPAITEGWRGMLAGNVDPIDSPWAMHEFILANAAAQMRDLTECFPGDREAVERLRNYALAFLSTPDLKISSVETVEEYEQAWAAAQAAGEPPFAFLAQALFQHVAARLGPDALGPAYRSRDFLLLVGQAIANFGGHYWRGVVQKHKVVP